MISDLSIGGSTSSKKLVRITSSGSGRVGRKPAMETLAGAATAAQGTRAWAVPVGPTGAGQGRVALPCPTGSSGAAPTAPAPETTVAET